MFRSSGGNSIVDIDEEDVLLTSDDTEDSSSSSRTRKSRLKRAVRSKVDKFSKPSKSWICFLRNAFEFDKQAMDNIIKCNANQEYFLHTWLVMDGWATHKRPLKFAIYIQVRGYVH